MFFHLQPRHYFKKDRHFYVCSFGGCGSWVLTSYLSNFGTVHHVHSRKPPSVVTTVEHEHFTTMPTPCLHNIVIFIYRDPVAALLSVQRRFPLDDHLKNIEAPDTIVTLDMLAETKQDLIGLTEFYKNYTTPSRERKYPIYCVKYEHLFENMSSLNYALGLVDYPKLYPKKKENKVTEIAPSWTGLIETYQPLRFDMAQRPFLTMASTSAN
jgi:hypothetical protein